MHPRGAPADAFTTIAEGTLAVTDAVLGQLDPSLLLNGQYDLVLTALLGVGPTITLLTQ